VWDALRNEHSDDAVVSQGKKALTIAQYLAETQTQLSLFVVVCDALDLGDVRMSVSFPSQIEVGLVRTPRPRLQSRRSQNPCKLVLSVCVTSKPALDEPRVDGERFTFERRGTYHRLPIGGAYS
jgi:hypothetical protein